MKISDLMIYFEGSVERVETEHRIATSRESRNCNVVVLRDVE